MLHPDNAKRIQRAQAALEEYVKIDDDVPLADVQDGVADLLADLRHFCEAMGQNFDSLNRVANRNYREERELNTSSKKDWRPE